jgi:cold shock CspA family protein
MDTARHFGEVVTYNKSRGFGFLRDLSNEGESYFFHITAVEKQIVLASFDQVTFELRPSERKPGAINAVEVKLAKRAHPLPNPDAEAVSRPDAGVQQ